MPTARRHTPHTSSHFGLRRDLLDAVGILLTQARSVLFITGPGLSSDSGLTNYRGLPGLLKRKPDDARSFEAALSSEIIGRKPEITWRYLLQMDSQVSAAMPCRGHEVLVGLEQSLPRSTIMTINVDRLHQRAGSHNVIEMHGAMHDLLCPRCEISRRLDNFTSIDVPPRCATCGQYVRPDMPLFGEALPEDPFTRLQIELDAGFDMVFSVGVPFMYPYLARPILLARAEGLPTVEIGPTQTDVSELVDFRFRGTPSRVLDLVWEVFHQLSAKKYSTGNDHAKS
jgi:NAD-dependent protein deacetylase/lipoamidase